MQLRVYLLALLLIASSCVSTVNSAETLRSEIIHSDLPLFGDDTENMWPQAFADEDSFGCASRVSFGDWLLHETDGDAAVWYRVRNYGVFHCWALVGTSNERQQLDHVEARPSFFILMETIEVSGAQRELWALQIGARTGSDYLLLARSPQPGPVESFDVLQVRCPSANVRDVGAIDIIRTRYCAINTKSELVRLARQMADLPPARTLQIVPVNDQRAN